MLRSWASLACLVAFPCAVAAQSLGEAAKQERERREKLERSGVAVKKVTDTELATAKGTLANDPNERKAEGKGAEGAKPSPDAKRERDEEAQGRRGDAAREQYWRKRVAEARARVAQAQARSDRLQRMIHLGQAYRRDANGGLVGYSAAQLKQMADAADAELAAAKAELEEVLEQGRRAGAQPGWLR
jgi:hypothetical protein